MNHRHTDFQSVAANSQASNKQQLTKPTEGSVQTSVQTKGKNSQKQGEIDTSNLPAELAEIVAVWQQLPKHIKAAIKALIQTHKSGGK